MRVICVFTGNRAEYGLLKPVMEKISQDDDLKLKLLVSGAHISSRFGMTCQFIEEDGFIIDERVKIPLDSDAASGLGKTMGSALEKYSKALKRLSPEILVVLGDRYEAFCIATAALVNNVPIAHIHGGELSYGAWDDSFRHCITKMSRVHFTCTDVYKKRVIQLGEHPDTVFNVGSSGVENIQNINLLSREDLNKLTGFDHDQDFFLVTYHPATLEGSKNKVFFKALLNALEDKNFFDYKIIFTKANPDRFGQEINLLIDEYVKTDTKRAVVFTSMGQVNYLSAMKYAKTVVGNSSSGIIEAPEFKIPVVNIGNRQKGRIRAENILDCEPETEEIVKTLEKALSSNFKRSLLGMTNPFKKKGTAEKIAKILKAYNPGNTLIKEFFDLKQE
jgi:GDP/UDP-N,N'-diacetylbacillosamine 2-epimerase (hydrolysing)